jgi:phage terminase small subunit
MFGPDGQLKPIAEMPEDARRALASVETDETAIEGAAVGVVRKVKMNDKIRALDSIGKHLGMFVEKIDHTFTALTPKQRAERVAALLAAASERKGGA